MSHIIRSDPEKAFSRSKTKKIHRERKPTNNIPKRTKNHYCTWTEDNKNNNKKQKPIKTCRRSCACRWSGRLTAPSQYGHNISPADIGAADSPNPHKPRPPATPPPQLLMIFTNYHRIKVFFPKSADFLCKHGMESETHLSSLDYDSADCHRHSNNQRLGIAGGWGV